MKQHFTLILFTLTTLQGFTQSYENCPALEWESSYGGTAAETYGGLINSNDGGFLLFGGARSADVHLAGNHGEEDMAVLKLNARGDILWSRHYGGPGRDYARAAATAVGGGYFLCGASGEAGQDVTAHNGAGDAWVLKVDEDGAISWQHSFGTSAPESCYAVQPTSDGGCVTLGLGRRENGPTQLLSQISRFDAAGNLLWARLYDHLFLNCPLSKANGNTFFLSTSSHIVRMDEQGAFLDSIPLPFFILPVKIQEMSDSSLLLAGNTYVSEYPGAIVLRLSPRGEIIWEQRYNLAENQYAAGFQVSREGHLFVLSQREEEFFVSESRDYSLAEISPDGNILQHLHFGGSRADEAEAIALAPDGGLLLSGISRSADGDISNPIGDYDFWVVKLSAIPAFGFPADSTICDAEQFTLSIPGLPDGSDILWSDGSTDTTLTISASGTYWASASIGECRASDTIRLNLPVVDWQGLPADTTLCDQSALVLDATLEGAALYLWQDGAQDPLYEVIKPDRYLVKAVVDDCVLEDSITVRWCEPCLAIPNAFTPNGDGVNDFFAPIRQCPFPAYRLQVFNRWGQLVFETEDAEKGWDGTSNGQPAPSEVYFYQLSYQEFEGEPAERRQGDVVLLR